MTTRLLIVLFIAALTHIAAAADYYISPNGSDENAGTKARPFATIQKAANFAQPGDRCYILPGRYRETVALKRSGTPGKPIRFIATQPGAAIIDGSDPIKAKWQKHEGSIWRVPLDRPQIEQVFVDDVMQHEARWPDMPFEKRWDRKFWGKVDKTSEYGKVRSKSLASTGIDFTGAIAMLNVGHQFFTWTRTVTSHKAGSDTFTYDRDLPGLAFLDPKTGIQARGGKVTPWIAKQWSDDYFYLFGKLNALTVPTEWFHATDKKLLYYMPKHAGPPRGLTVKARDFGITASKINHVQFEGVQLFGCAFRFNACKHITLTNCHVKYPGYRRRIVASEQEQHRGPYPTAVLSGSNNTMKRCSVQHAGGAALVITGENNLLENSIIADGCWSGTLHYSLLKVHGKGNVVRRNAIHQSGAPLIHHSGPNNIEFNHIHHGGMLSEDVSAVYTQKERARGAVIRYNWIHSVRTGHGLGQGVRGDDLTRGLIVHHNVIWNCGMVGIIVKGGQNQVFNNTVFNVTNGKPRHKNRAGLIIPTQPEPRKPWKAYHKTHTYLDVQNTDSVIANNLVDDIYFRHKTIEVPGIQANHEMKDKARDYLVDPEKFDFRLKPEAIAKLPKPMKITTQEGAKSTSYIGAYAPGQPGWKPGPDWSLENQRR
jgi:hypothetical protein